MFCFFIFFSLIPLKLSGAFLLATSGSLPVFLFCQLFSLTFSLELQLWTSALTLLFSFSASLS